MDLAVPLAGYFLTVLLFMFGGRRRRSFTEASQAAAGTIITLVCLAAILWFVFVVLSRFKLGEHQSTPSLAPTSESQLVMKAPYSE